MADFGSALEPRIDRATSFNEIIGLENGDRVCPGRREPTL